MKDKSDILLKKLDQFIRKYYKNQLIKGSILSGALLIILFLAFVLGEHIVYFPTMVRTAMFFIFLSFAAIVLIKYIVIPIAGFLRIGKHINYDQAARIIGNHFTDVKDQLLNTLQLKEIVRSKRSDLLIASINQRTERLKPIPFNTAVDFKANRKYLKYLLIPVAILGVVIFSSPGSVTEPTKRIIQYKQHFEKPLPYEIRLENKELEVVQQEDFEIRATAKGEEIPADLYINTKDGRFRMENEGVGQFYHKVKNVQKDLEFSLENHQYSSEVFRLKVLPKPTILNFNIELNYPDYTGKQNETIENRGDLIMPEGTKVTWNFFTRDTDSILFRMKDFTKYLGSENSNKFTLNRTIKINSTYTIKSSNQYLVNNDSLVYSLNVIKDEYPDIDVNEYRDSIDNRRIYFDGIIEDDYGFTRLNFNKKRANEERYAATDIITPGSQLKKQFFHFVDLKEIGLKPGETLEYYFEVWDNDEVNGYKSTKSQLMSFRAPTSEEIERESKQQGQRIKEDMESTIHEIEKLNKDIEKAREDLINQENLNWEQRENIKDLLKKHQNLNNKIEELSKMNKEKFKKETRFSEEEQRILEKQRQLEELFDKVLDEEMRKKIEELQKMMDSLNKDKLQEEMEELKYDNKELEEQLDRNLELFKQLEFEKELEESIKELEKMAEEQMELKKENDSEQQNDSTLKAKQDSLNKKFSDWKKEMDNLEKMNDELEYPNNFNRNQDQEEAINQEMRHSSQELQKGNNEDAGKSMKNSSDMMQQMQQSLAAMQQSMMMSGLAEDMKNLRSLLDNIVTLSFDQEGLIEELGNMSSNNPKYLDLIDKQNEISDELSKVKDSLYALSKRQIMIEPFINKEISNIERDFDQILESLQNRRVRTANSKQQYVMTSLNNLALFMSEMLEKMRQQMSMAQGQGQSNSSCPNPGGGKQSMQNIKQLQQQLNQQMQQMKEGMQKGEMPGGQQMSKRLAKMAAQQEQIRRMMEEYQEELKKEGQGYGGELEKTMKDMEETETDLVNRMITNETLKRQKEILTRLLKSEKAEREREKEKRRESREAEEYELSNPPKLEDFKAQQRHELEMLRTVPPKLKPFYKNKVNEYFYNFSEDNE